MSPDPSTTPKPGGPGKLFSKGVVLGPDGKPCKTCNSFSSFSTAATGLATKDSSSSSALLKPQSDTVPSGCPPDSLTLGRHTWTLLHSIAGQYPIQASLQKQSEMGQFLRLFSRLYPCSPCAKDFEEYIGPDGKISSSNSSSERNPPRLQGRDEFGLWLCEAHNAVNEKLGKEVFDCSKWKERWVDGASHCQ